MLHIHYRFPHWNQQNSIIFRLVAKKTHAIQRKNPNIHQLLKKKKKTVGNQTVWEYKKKKRSKEKESFNDLNWDLIEQKRGMD